MEGSIPVHGTGTPQVDAKCLPALPGLWPTATSLVFLRRLLCGLYLHRTSVLRGQERGKDCKYVGNEAIAQNGECFSSGGLASEENGKSLRAAKAWKHLEHLHSGQGQREFSIMCGKLLWLRETSSQVSSFLKHL